MTQTEGGGGGGLDQSYQCHSAMCNPVCGGGAAAAAVVAMAVVAVCKGGGERARARENSYRFHASVGLCDL